MKFAKNPANRIADILIYGFFIIMCLMIVIPFYNMILFSITPYKEAVTTPLSLLPRGFSAVNYQLIFRDNRLINAMLVSVFNVVVGTVMAVAITTTVAYPLSRKIPFRRSLLYFCLFTMFFNAGIIPWYLVMRDIGMINSIFAMSVPSMLSTFNLILMRNYFLSIPESLEESARIDGAGDFVIMVRIFVPLSMPIIATVGLFYAVWFWNDWWFPLLLVPSGKLMPLPLFLRNLVIENSIRMVDPNIGGAASGDYLKSANRGVQMAAVAVGTLPILCVYPFVQKYFTKGIMLGAIKA